jgi:hypothetical protein
MTPKQKDSLLFLVGALVHIKAKHFVPLNDDLDNR